MKKNNKQNNKKETYTKKNQKKETKVNTIEDDFNKYAEGDPMTIQEDGMIEMGKTLGIDIYSDLFITFFFYKCKAKAMDQITLDQYTTGLNALGIKALFELKSKISNLRKSMQPGNSEFNEYYSFLFAFNMDKKTKKISYEAAELYFKNLFSKHKALVSNFLNYLHKVKQEGLTSDQWNCFKGFIETLGDKFPDDYCINDAWPTLFDDFYIDHCKKHNIALPDIEMKE